MSNREVTALSDVHRDSHDLNHKLKFCVRKVEDDTQDVGNKICLTDEISHLDNDDRNLHDQKDDCASKPECKAVPGNKREMVDLMCKKAERPISILPHTSETRNNKGSQADNPKFKVTKVGFHLGEGDIRATDSNISVADLKNLNSSPINNPNESCPVSPTSSYATQTYATYNMKTFGQDTLETLPKVDHYRNIFSTTAGIRQRPTLTELHDVQAEEIADALFKDDADMGDGVKDAAPDQDKPPIIPGHKFGWIKGVLVRCLLNIYGVMLFLRLSWVVGQAGIGLAIVVIVLAAIVTTITTLSMSAICTNGEVKGGGAYFMISRSLGPEFGGAIGVIFSVANAVAVAMYIVGFAETIRDILLEHDKLMVGPVHDVRIIGSITLVCLLGIALIGMQWEARAQIGLLVVLMIAIFNYIIGSFIPPTDFEKSRGFVGYSGETFLTNFGPDFGKRESFFSVFGIFFPAATGILAGANISGDLLDPQKAIPKGTLLAILISSVTYIGMAIIAGSCALREASGELAEPFPGTTLVSLISNLTSLGATTSVSVMNDPSRVAYLDQASNSSSAAPLPGTPTSDCPHSGCVYGLIHDMQIVSLISGFGPITIAGIIAATLSSALASLVSAPKVFQAVAKDKIFPYIYVFAKGYGNSEEPRRAYFLAATIAFACVCIGQLNDIAPLISNFFLMSYALINYSCFDASLAKAPGWRPAFKYYSKWLALLGSVLCLGVMFVINWITALITFAMVCALYLYMHHRKPDINWGSSTQAHVYRSALQHSLKLVSVMDHIKNFRPQILVLTGFPSDRPALVDFASNITKGISFMACGNVIQDNTCERLRDPRLNNYRAASWLHKRKVKSFYTQIMSRNLRAGVRAMLQCTGVGKMRPNILLLGFKADWKSSSFEEVDNYVNILHDALSLHYGIGILRLKEGFNLFHFQMDNTDEDITPSSNNTHEPTSAANLLNTPSEENLVNGCPSNYLLEPKPVDIEQDSPVGEPVLIGYKSLSTGGVQFSLEPRNKDRDAKLSASEESVVQIVQSDDEENCGNSGEIDKCDRNLIKYVNRFQRRQGKGTIDVYWLFDDGGLTLLLPYILSKKKQWSNCKLRVFVAGSKQIQLDRDKRHMATLLSKFRIEYSSMTVIPDIGKKPGAVQMREFENLLKEVQESHNIGESELEEQKDKINRHLRCREILLQHSSDASLVVMTLPMPRRQLFSAGLYMAWLEVLTRDMPPILLLRGNQDSVLTFYS